MKNYRYLIFDADHTVIDFDADERRAFRAAFSAAGVAAEEAVIEDLWAFSARNWEALGLNNVHLPAVQQGYHAMYRDHVRAIFDYIEARYGLNGRRQAAEAAFSEALTLPAHTFAGVGEVLSRLKAHYRLCVATNGLIEMQPGRLSSLAGNFFRVFISEEVGAIKPTGAFFSYMLRALDARAEECLMIGDSLSSDVKGANAAGMDCVWLNRSGRALPEGYFATAVISSLDELPALLGVQEERENQA